MKTKSKLKKSKTRWGKHGILNPYDSVSYHELPKETKLDPGAGFEMEYYIRTVKRKGKRPEIEFEFYQPKTKSPPPEIGKLNKGTGDKIYKIRGRGNKWSKKNDITI